MVALITVLSAIVLLTGASVWADRRFRKQERLPMQWSLAGKVNWTAPRRLALAFTPVLAALVLGLTATLARHDEELGAPVLVLIGLAFLAAHGLHLWLIARTTR